MRAERLQQEFRIITELFDWVGLRTNVGKTVSMACQSCHALGVHYMEAYGLRMTFRGITHRERLCLCVHCPECGLYLMVRSLITHGQVQHVVGRGGLRKTLHHPPPGDPCTYRVYLPRSLHNLACTLGGLPGRASIWTALQIHSVRLHVPDTILVLKEVILPLFQ